MPKVEDLGEVDVLVAKKQGMKASEGLVDDITIPHFLPEYDLSRQPQ